MVRICGTQPAAAACHRLRMGSSPVTLAATRQLVEVPGRGRTEEGPTAGWVDPEVIVCRNVSYCQQWLESYGELFRMPVRAFHPGSQESAGV